MKARFTRFFGEDHADKLTFRTINGLCAVVIRYHAAQKGTQPFALADDEARFNAIVRELLSLANQTPATWPFLLRLQELRETIESMEPDLSCPFVLSAVHAGKGPEYDRVILIDAVDGLFTSDPFPHDNEGRTALEEDRRLFYVKAARV